MKCQGEVEEKKLTVQIEELEKNIKDLKITLTRFDIRRHISGRLNVVIRINVIKKKLKSREKVDSENVGMEKLHARANHDKI